MAGYKDLREFERAVIVGAREMGHSIFEVEMKFGFSPRQHRHWTVNDWKHVAWSDESRFLLNRDDRRVRAWRQPHEPMDPTCQQGTVKAGTGFVMV
ncbi:transposable element Tcb2 transposase [Trichonephila clavipes]|nr:transposable element Tcb2 transposase [Trichonephila clavipes]